ncbi:MAG: DUF493 domain-containing protein [bacterium]|nr:DUF493 domain-containing protein [bacterium]
MDTTPKNIEKNVDYPTEVMFKAVFRKNENTPERIEQLLAENGLTGTVTGKESSKNTFISYTVTAVFQTHDQLHDICRKISTLEGYMTLF